MKCDFKLGQKDYSLDVKVCNTAWSQGWGLMFRKKSKPLLFVFKRSSVRPIHSFFCKPFIAIWFHNRRIVDAKIIKDWKFSIIPKEKFDVLLEIPENDNKFSEICRRLRNL